MILLIRIGGEDWEIPTEDLYKELIDQCVFKPSVIEGQRGWKVIGKNGHSIFLPAAGSMSDTLRVDYNMFARYWTASSLSNNKLMMVKGLRYFPLILPIEAHKGLSVRPISRIKAKGDKSRRRRYQQKKGYKDAPRDSVSSAPTFGLG